MRLISVNIGKEREVPYGKMGRSSIHKLPVDAPVRIGALGLDGDMISDKENHGGVDQAVYVFGTADYAWWSESLDQPLAPGTFGENLTVSDLESAPMRIGDLLHIGEQVTLQVTSPRIPCVVLAGRMSDPAFVKRFRFGERPGMYCRVIREGVVQAGDPVRIEPYQGETITVLELFRLFYEKLGEADLRRVLAAPIDIRGREDYEKQLAAISAEGS
jgi:MOSC domain-containing protein YiiM